MTRKKLGIEADPFGMGFHYDCYTMGGQPLAETATFLAERNTGLLTMSAAVSHACSAATGRAIEPLTTAIMAPRPS